MIKKIIPLMLLSIIYLSCKSDKKAIAKEEIMQTDREFSALSERAGRNEAFISYFDTAGILMRENSKPVIGINEISKLLLSRPDDSYTLTWEPTYADVASSCDLGFTIGIWTLKTENKTMKGTYLTVWRKNSKGQWKMAADIGNQGIGE